MNGVTFEVRRPQHASRALIPGVHYRLKSEALFEPLRSDGPPKVSDLLAIAAAVYSIDRLVKRSYQCALRGPGRVLHVRARVAAPAFWTDHADHLREVLAVLSGDQWTFEFEQGQIPQWQSSMLKVQDTICLYSGGLDSLAGLAYRLAETSGCITSVTMLHVGRQRARVKAHIDGLNAHYGARVFPVLVPMALISPPRLDDQELSQRCRGFIFASLGIGAAAALGAKRIEVYENGVGALNVPLMFGMSVGGRTTKGCHPRFMELMSELASAVLDREVSFVLPHEFRTKGELVSVLRPRDLQALAVKSFSCIHTSPRVAGEPKHCGFCPACIGRRQAFLAGGVEDDCAGYKADLLNPGDVDRLRSDDLSFLKATLMQVSLLAQTPEGLPAQFEHYFRSSRVPLQNGSGWTRHSAMLQRYRSEWESLARIASDRGVSWSRWLGLQHEQVMA
jgi:7-cyano-7-deazaguanine synthase in queuosine biosynthesis